MATKQLAFENVHARSRLMRRMLVGVVAVVSGGIFSNSLRGSNIFDDDWAPPQRTEPVPKPAKAADHEPSTPDAAPPKATPTSPEPTAPPTETAPKIEPEKTVRLSIPAKEDQARLRKVMREVYARQIADRSPAGRTKLAQSLLSEAAKSDGQPTDRYVMLIGAYEAARDARSAALCFSAADAIARAFEVDDRALKLATMSATVKGSSPDDAKTIVAEGIALISDAMADEDFDSVRKCASIVESAAARTRDRALQASARSRLAVSRALVDESARVQKDFETLRTAPEDAAANLAVGRFLCFVKGDWKGLANLARGSDGTLRELAKQEEQLADASAGTSASVLAAADAWWDQTDRETDSIAKSAMKSHAGELYDRAAAGLSGLAKVKAQKRIAEVAAIQKAAGGTGGALSTRGPAVTAANPGDAAEAKKIIADLTEKYPANLKDLKQLRVVKIHDASELHLNFGEMKEVPRAFSTRSAVGTGSGIMMWGIYEDLDPGKYLIAYRVQLLSNAPGANVCFLDVCNHGTTIAEHRPASDEFKANDWQSMPVLLTLADRTTVEYRLWPNEHTMALDRVYVFKIE